MHIVWHDVVGSTNDEAVTLIGSGALSPIVVASRAQTGGRGRNGRSWTSPEGGAWFSVAWLPPAGWCEWEVAPLAVGHGILNWMASNVAGLLGSREVEAAETLVLKWPNDVLSGGRKLAGVLCERPWAGAAGADWLVAGVGVNVLNDVADLGNGLRVPAVSLKEMAGTDTSLTAESVVDGCAKAIVDELAAMTDPSAVETLIERVNEELCWRGERVSVSAFDGATVEGVLEGVGSDGALVMRDSLGNENRLLAGDVERLRSADV